MIKRTKTLGRKETSSVDTNEEVDMEKSGGRERQGDQKKRKKTGVLKQTRSRVLVRRCMCRERVDMENEKWGREDRWESNELITKSELTRPPLFS